MRETDSNLRLRCSNRTRSRRRSQIKLHYRYCMFVPGRLLGYLTGLFQLLRLKTIKRVTTVVLIGTVGVGNRLWRTLYMFLLLSEDAEQTRKNDMSFADVPSDSIQLACGRRVTRITSVPKRTKPSNFSAVSM
jgi:hypothetical protein